MKFLSSTQSIGACKADVVVIGLFEDHLVMDGELAQLDEQLHNGILEVLKQKQFKGEQNQIHNIPAHGLLPMKQLVLVGLGKQKEFAEEKLRKAIGIVTKVFKTKNILKFSVYLNNLSEEVTEHATTITEAVTLANYVFDQYKTDAKAKLPSIEEVTIIHSGSDTAVKKAMQEAEIVCAGNILTRNLINEPPIVLTPDELANRAKKMSKKYGLKCSVFDEKHMKKLGMNAALAVGSGSSHPPRFIIVEHNPRAKGKTIVLVGKGITFDSGGLGIKPGQSMQTMKCDMGGAATVLGIMQTIAQLKVPVHVVGLIAAAENMTGANAYRPDDIITAMNGKSIEIWHTDAEGRVTMADSLSYAAKYKPDMVIDFATLTGAAVVALGDTCAAIMGNDQPTMDKLKASGEIVFERLWQLPLYEEYCNMVKGEVADVKNLGGWHKKAGTITAGAFLKEFVPEGAKWVHMDIAGTAFADEDKEYWNKGGTGFGVRLMTHFLKHQKS